MRAILLNSKERTVKEVDVRMDGKSMSNDHIYELLGCEIFTLPVYLNDKTDLGSDEDHALLCDDEGLLNDPQDFMLLKAYPQPIAGNGLIIGPSDEDGNTTPCTIDVNDVQVMWMDRNDIRLYMRCQQKIVDRMRSNPDFKDVYFTTMKEALDD